MKPCQLRKSCRCGSQLGHIVPGTPPHAAKVVCWECGRFLKWLSKDDLERAQKFKLIDSVR